MGRPFGQHFLRDERVLHDILTAAAIQPGERVLEIGPGRGVLTEPLAAAVAGTGLPDPPAGGKVVAVEADIDMAEPLFGRWAEVDIVHQDVMKVDLERLGPFDAVVANLPYQISGPVTAKLLDVDWKRAVLMYQAEFGERLLAGPGPKTYGRLSVLVQRVCTVEKVRTVSPGAFDPPPRVDSIVLNLTRRDVPLFEPQDMPRFHAIVETAFGQRRKKLRNSLAGLVDAAVLQQLGVADLRPEQIPPDMFGAIADGKPDVARGSD